MHEMSLCESIMQIIEDEAQRQGFSRVTRVRLEIGRLSGVEIEAIRFGFDAVTHGSLADGAALEIIELPGRAWCLPCGCEVEVRQRFDACPLCGSYQLQVVDGDAVTVWARFAQVPDGTVRLVGTRPHAVAPEAVSAAGDGIEFADGVGANWVSDFNLVHVQSGSARFGTVNGLIQKKPSLRIVPW